MWDCDRYYLIQNKFCQSSGLPSKAMAFKLYILFFKVNTNIFY